jgi:hypothetical protein
MVLPTRVGMVQQPMANGRWQMANGKWVLPTRVGMVRRCATLADVFRRVQNVRGGRCEVDQ